MNDIKGSTCTRTPTKVAYIENHWPHLQPHVQEAIMTLVDGALNANFILPSVRDGRTAERSANARRTMSSE